MITCAAQDGDIAAVVSQVPNLDNIATARFLATRVPIGRTLRLGVHLALDVLAGAFGRPPVVVPIMGRSGEFAAYVSDEGWEDFELIRGASWNNRLALRGFVRLPIWRPVTYLDRLPCRVQFHACIPDDLTPAAPTLKAAERLGDRAELLRYDTGHFGIYVGDALQRALDSQTDFLERELAATEPARSGTVTPT